MASIVDAVGHFAWPLTVVMIVALFRTDLKHLLSRLQKISPSSAEFGERSQQISPIRRDLDSIAREVIGVGQINPLIKSSVESLTNKAHEREPNDPDKRQLRLAIFAASVLLDKDFLHIYINIFRSQLEVVERAANTTGNIDLRPFYEVHVARFEAGRRGDGTDPVVFSFDQWSAFLFSTGLMAPATEHTSLSERGREFLAFVRRERLPQIAIW